MDRPKGCVGIRFFREHRLSSRLHKQQSQEASQEGAHVCLKVAAQEAASATRLGQGEMSRPNRTSLC